MRRLVVSEFLTLDGVMEDPGGAEDFEYGGWSLQYFSDEYLKFKYDELFASGALLLGRNTYEIFAEAWPSRTAPDGFADYMNSMPKFVVSTTLRNLAWKNSELINGDIATAVRKLKLQPGKDILVAGSGELVRCLMHHDLVDELRLMIHPVVLGKGKRLFTDGNGMKRLKLKESVVFGSGIVVFIYEGRGW
jgi:dihydrofolate reductase